MILRKVLSQVIVHTLPDIGFTMYLEPLQVDSCVHFQNIRLFSFHRSKKSANFYSKLKMVDNHQFEDFAMFMAAVYLCMLHP